MDALGSYLLEALRLGMLIAAPALVVSAAVGLVSGVLQALTQVDDPALSFVPRLFAVAITLGAGATWMSGHLLGFTRQLWKQLAALAS